MREFEYYSASTLDEAVDFLRQSGSALKVRVIAGGTDVLSGLKRDIYPEDKYPGCVLNISDIEGLSEIYEDNVHLHIGALTKLVEVSNSELLKESYPAIAMAAAHTASPQLREMGTVAGNICQENRCWYYRSDGNYFHCKMKGGKQCFAAAGDNRYHSVYGAVNGCVAVNPSDIAPALYAYNATVVTTKRSFPISELWTQDVCTCTTLEPDELVKELLIPIALKGVKSTFIKLSQRKSIDFPILNCAVVAGPKTSIVLNAVAGVPFKAMQAETVIGAAEITEELAAHAGDVAVQNARALKKNAYKIEQIRVIVKRALLECK